MKKILDQLELHVQWLALLLGIIFVLYTAYAYLLQPPVKVELAGEHKSPGEVDDFIWERVGNDLDRETKHTSVPKMESPELLTLFTHEISYDGKELPQSLLASTILPLREVPPDPNKTVKEPTPGIDPKQPNPQNAVTGLPVLVAAKIDGFRSGMSSVTPIGPNVGPNPTPIDKTWVTVRGEIDMNALVKSFADVKIPAGASKTSFILLSLEREEKMADSSWGNSTMVPHIQTTEVPAFPAANAVANDLWTYLQWAEAHTIDVLQAPFYTVLKGDPWGVPGEQVLAINNTGQAQPNAFDPSQWIDRTPQQIEAAHLTMEQKRAISALKQKRASESRKGRAPSRSGPPRGGPPEGAMEQAPQDGGRPPGYGGMRPPPGAMPNPEEEGMGEYGGNPQQQVSASFPVPSGAFDPNEWLKTNAAKPSITVWAHDETAQPGHTYRYRLGYTIKNPIFYAVNVAKNAKLTQIFSIDADKSGWTDDVEIIPTVNFWIARQPRTPGGAVDMQVFRWQAGSTVTKQFTVNPGDVIGAPDPASDFTTGWTLVDVMTDPRTQLLYVLVIDPNGVVHRRDYSSDSIDPKLKSWRDQAAVAVAPTPPAAVATR